MPKSPGLERVGPRDGGDAAVDGNLGILGLGNAAWIVIQISKASRPHHHPAQCHGSPDRRVEDNLPAARRIGIPVVIQRLHHQEGGIVRKEAVDRAPKKNIPAWDHHPGRAARFTDRGDVGVGLQNQPGVVKSDWTRNKNAWPKKVAQSGRVRWNNCGGRGAQIQATSLGPEACQGTQAEKVSQRPGGIVGLGRSHKTFKSRSTRAEQEQLFPIRGSDCLYRRGGIRWIGGDGDGTVVDGATELDAVST